MKRETLLVLLLALVMVLGLVLRLHQLGDESLWLDECFTYVYSGKELTEIVNVLKEDWHPIGYYIVTYFTTKFIGTSEIALRLPSLIFGMLSLILVYVLGRNLINRPIGLLASLFTAVSYTAVLYSQEAKMYSMLMLFSTLSIIYFVSLLKSGRLNHFILFGISNAFLIHTHVVGIFILLALIIYYFSCSYLYSKTKINLTENLFSLFKRTGAKYFPRKLFYSLLVTLLLYLPWLPIFLKYQVPGLFVYGLKAKLIEKLGFNLYPTIVILSVVGIVAYILIVFYFAKRKDLLEKIIRWFSRLKFNRYIFMVCFILYLGVDLFLSPRFFASVSFIRFSIFLLPLFYILLANCFFKLSKPIFTLLLALFLIISSFELYNYYHLDSKEQFKEAGEFLTHAANKDDVIFLYRAGITKACFDYYYRGPAEEIRLLGNWDAGKLTLETESKQYAYLFLNRNYEVGDLFQRTMEWNYPLVEHKRFIGIEVYKYAVS